jgi:hypothetical protein
LLNKLLIKLGKTEKSSGSNFITWTRWLRLEHKHRINYIAPHLSHHLKEHVVAFILVFN